MLHPRHEDTTRAAFSCGQILRNTIIKRIQIYVDTILSPILTAAGILITVFLLEDIYSLALCLSGTGERVRVSIYP
jgi:hypothetical protein